MANQLGMVFAKLDCKPRWRERLPELAIPALVVHGRRDPFFPVGNGEALAREIPGARLLVLEAARSSRGSTRARSPRDPRSAAGTSPASSERSALVKDANH
jgi:predicted alpha/beta-hydrolase family hydrolase